MGHSQRTSGPGAAAARWLIVLWLMHILIERSASCWHLHQLFSQTTQYLDSWLSDLEVEGGGNVPQCPIAGDATGCSAHLRTFSAKVRLAVRNDAMCIFTRDQKLTINQFNHHAARRYQQPYAVQKKSENREASPVVRLCGWFVTTNWRLDASFCYDDHSYVGGLKPKQAPPAL